VKFALIIIGVVLEVGGLLLMGVRPNLTLARGAPRRLFGGASVRSNRSTFRVPLARS